MSEITYSIIDEDSLGWRICRCVTKYGNESCRKGTEKLNTDKNSNERLNVLSTVPFSSLMFSVFSILAWYSVLPFSHYSPVLLCLL